jgi:pimeloyl-ACP methyl ester carboxylesterase
MTSVRTERVRAADGRLLAVDVVGPEGGPTVVLCHPAPGSRRLDPDQAATAAAGVRLLTIDRPGYGGSEAGDAPVTIPSLADDVATVLDALDVRRAHVAGWSAGGRVAMAFAARHPERVGAVALLSTPAPDEAVPWYDDQARGLIAAFRDRPDSAVPQMTEMLAPVAGDPAGAVAMVCVGPADDDVLDRPGVRASVEAMLAEGFRAGAGGLAADIASYTLHPWGFDPSAVSARVCCWYGREDALVPPAHGEWWAGQVADGSLEVVEGVGHLVPYVAWPAILSEL